MIGHDDSVNVVFTTYSELSAFSFSIPSGTHFVYTEHTSRSATENVQHGWFNAGQLTSFICHIDSYHSRTVSTDVNEGKDRKFVEISRTSVQPNSSDALGNCRKVTVCNGYLERPAILSTSSAATDGHRCSTTAS